jgi:hypothetical protein
MKLSWRLSANVDSVNGCQHCVDKTIDEGKRKTAQCSEALASHLHTAITQIGTVLISCGFILSKDCNVPRGFLILKS